MRFFLHLWSNGEWLQDPEGAEFASMEDARVEAIQSARDLMAERLRTGKALISNSSFEITDESGRVRLSVAFQDALPGE